MREDESECVVIYCIEHTKKEDTARCVVSVDYEYIG